MNTLVYNRREVGMRLRKRRKEMGLTAAALAEKIGKDAHYYRDIERGQCGMSIETLVNLSHALILSTDYILYGNDDEDDDTFLSAQKIACNLLGRCDEKTRDNAVVMLKTFIELSDHENRELPKRPASGGESREMDSFL